MAEDTCAQEFELLCRRQGCGAYAHRGEKRTRHAFEALLVYNEHSYCIQDKAVQSLLGIHSLQPDATATVRLVCSLMGTQQAGTQIKNQGCTTCCRTFCTTLGAPCLHTYRQRLSEFGRHLQVHGSPTFLHSIIHASIPLYIPVSMHHCTELTLSFKSTSAPASINSTAKAKAKATFMHIVWTAI